VVFLFGTITRKMSPISQHTNIWDFEGVGWWRGHFTGTHLQKSITVAGLAKLFVQQYFLILQKWCCFIFTCGQTWQIFFINWNERFTSFDSVHNFMHKRYFKNSIYYQPAVFKKAEVVILKTVTSRALLGHKYHLFSYCPSSLLSFVLSSIMGLHV